MNSDLTGLKGYNLKIFQHKKGYRFSIDSFLLAWFVSKQKFKNALEIGAGSGVVSLLVERMTEQSKTFELVEIQETFCELLKKNIEINKPFKSEFIVRCEDARYILSSIDPEVVYLNPPFTDFTKGKVSPNIEKALSRHTYLLNIDSVLQWYVRETNRTAKLLFVETMKNFNLYKEKMDKFKIFPEELIFIKPFKDEKPNLFLIKIGKNDANLSESYLTIYDKKNVYTDKVKQILGIL